MYRIVTTNRFEKDLLLAKKRNLPVNELMAVVELLSEGKPLPAKYKDHMLKGVYTGLRECHLKPDWLLIYHIEKEIELLSLLRTGTHSDLF